MQIEKSPIDIMLPPELREASARSLKLCELFVGGLISSSNKLISLSVDVANKSVECTDPGLRETIRLFLGAGRLDEFMQQMLVLLHRTEDVKSVGELRVMYNGKMRAFSFFKIESSNFCWEIVSK